MLSRTQLLPINPLEKQVFSLMNSLISQHSAQKEPLILRNQSWIPAILNRKNPFTTTIPILINTINGAPELHAKVGNLLIKFMRQFGDRFGKDPTARGEYAELADTTPGKAWHGGISYDKTYAGLNMVNPFKAIWFNPAGISEGAMASGPRRAVAESCTHFYMRSPMFLSVTRRWFH
jgi:hypothetical protein